MPGPWGAGVYAAVDCKARYFYPRALGQSATAPHVEGETMILTWLWKLVQWFRQGGDAASPALEAPTSPRLGETPTFRNQSNDRDHSDPVIFEPDAKA